MRRMMLKRMMVMIVKLQSRVYPLLHYDDYGAGWSVPLHRIRFSKIKWKQLLRGRMPQG
jgi:hypothetical protein